ncbi:MAG: hypothetical protein ACI4O0_03625 [Candidatus Limivicinus sp.]
MKLSEKWSQDGRLKLLTALLLNLLFLLLLFACYTPGYEENDDFWMSRFVDGQLTEKTAYIPFVNIVQGLLLKLCYVLGGDQLPWYTLCQYGLMLFGFSAVTWVLLRRFRLLPALSMTAIILLSSGMDAYLTLNFSKTAAVAAVGGLSLMLFALEGGEEARRRAVLRLGFALALLGFLWRYEVFFTAAAIMAPVGLVSMLELLSRPAEGGDKLRQAWRYARPFLLLLLTVVLLYGVNTLVWSRGEYGEFTQYNKIRHVLMDYGTAPKYEQAEEFYQTMDMDENAVGILRSWNFYDTEKFSRENLEKITVQRDSILQKRSPGQCFLVLLTECVPSFYATPAFAAAGLMLLLWLLCGRRSWKHFLGAGLVLGFFCLIYMAMIYLNRCLINRVDMGLFLAVAVAICFLMDGEKLGRRGIACVLVLLLALLLGSRAFPERCLLRGSYSIPDRSGEKAALEVLLTDEEHLYLCKMNGIAEGLYGPLETAPAEFGDKVVKLGGWSVKHPSISRVLAAYGIENPYPDMIGNERVLLIDKNVEQTLNYLHRYYDPEAWAEPVEALSAQTGLSIYRIHGRQG